MPSSADLRVSNLFSFNSHVALVTGGASGLGEMAAQGLVQNGARVIIASRKEEELKKCTDQLNKLGPGTCEYIVADLKDKAGCDHLAAEVKKRIDRLTVLVNNSGATWGAPLEDFPEVGWDKAMSLNVKAIFYLTVGVLPLLQKAASPDMPSRVINIASIWGISTLDPTTTDEGGLSPPGTGTFSYGPSKAACIHLSRQQSSKFAPMNIMVNCVCPGVFPSRMSNFGIEKYLDTLLDAQPTGRIGKPEDFAALILFLCSYGASHLTGNVIELDGGSSRSGWKGGSEHMKL
ncbi:beta-ketoacyl reductase [Histoplasma capsulatum G186AR]|uniref:Beta-ketoacyl reductase n=2 Tax=Ajellomyces capsulatus TaxID=5037 RepID=C0NXU5_AJECG|nr:beta-ketoacyl reductase [Histoplasma capsulatum G186AR]EEH03613.1 beta-ketoacyl reductase [Histoplasma capsulatum G186AR]KAG5293813.1 beta-ketoacyl reductase [Histoplasma capsulatum]QSS75265.1 beta-ketoacyl reductase [Histoplasma capsulatum G186AR]